MSNRIASYRCLALALPALAAACLAAPAFAAETIFTGGVGTWDLPANWTQSGGVNVKPGPADAAVILDGSVVNLSSIENILELQLSHPANNVDTSATHGVARLNILPGAVLTTNGNTTGIRLGRALDAGQAIGSSRGEIVQTGGTLLIAQGANGLRLSQAESPSADSLYRISGGQLRGGPAGTGAAGIVSDLRLGTVTNVWGTAEFHVVGNGASEIAFLDLQMAASSANTGTSILHFSIGAGGVTPITVADELQFRGSATTYGQNLLQIDLIGAPAPDADINLIVADRLSTNTGPSGADFERFTGMPNLTPIVREFDGSLYTYALTYLDGSDDGVLDARVYLDFVSVVPVPEPTSVAALGLGSLGLLTRARRKA